MACLIQLLRTKTRERARESPSTAPTVPSASSRAATELGGFDHEHGHGVAVRAFIKPRVR
jgi:hypothetical protein